MVDWSDDRIAALSDQDLKNLVLNAERKSVAGVIAQCKAEMEKRNASKPRKASKPRTEVKEFEHEMSGQLAAVGKEMAEKYDLSEETAKARSVGVKGFERTSCWMPKVTRNSAAISATVPLRSMDISRIGREDIVSLGASCSRIRRSRTRIPCGRTASHDRRRKALGRSPPGHSENEAQKTSADARVQGLPARRGIRRGAGEDHCLIYPKPNGSQSSIEAQSNPLLVAKTWRLISSASLLAMTTNQSTKPEEITMSPGKTCRSRLSSRRRAQGVGLPGRGICAARAR